ncbi:hypothetical protein RyT2_19140 [Pseudolactococcus yaeyamensis]
MISNSDSFVYLGGNEPGDWKYISQELMGKQTVTQRNHSTSRGQSTSNSESVQRTARDLMTPDEISVMPNSESLVRIRGMRFYKGKKFDLSSHPRFMQISDGDPSRWWDYHIYPDETEELVASIDFETSDLEVVDVNLDDAALEEMYHVA